MDLRTRSCFFAHYTHPSLDILCGHIFFGWWKLFWSWPKHSCLLVYASRIIIKPIVVFLLAMNECGVLFLFFLFSNQMCQFMCKPGYKNIKKKKKVTKKFPWTLYSLLLKFMEVWLCISIICLQALHSF